jgi:hypothetical protein
MSSLQFSEVDYAGNSDFLTDCHSRPNQRETRPKTYKGLGLNMAQVRAVLASSAKQRDHKTGAM